MERCGSGGSAESNAQICNKSIINYDYNYRLKNSPVKKSVLVVRPGVHSNGIVSAGRIVLNIHGGEGEGPISSTFGAQDEEGALAVSVLSALGVLEASGGGVEGSISAKGGGGISEPAGEELEGETPGWMSRSVMDVKGDEDESSGLGVVGASFIAISRDKI